MNEEKRDRNLTTADLAAGTDRKTEERYDEKIGERAEVMPGRGGSGAAAVRTDEASAPLFTQDETADMRMRWDSIQTGFVDEPRKAVQDADQLVASAIKRLAEVFAEERSKLEQQWDRGTDISTEDLRQALRRYRSFFDRLLSV